MKSVQEVLTELDAGRFDALVGTIEGTWLEAKQSPYPLDSTRQKQELAKDVSALANAEGGIIVIGFRTARDPQTAGDRIAEVCPFPTDLVSGDQYRKVLEAWTCPPLDNIEVRVFADRSDPSRCVAAILVDPSLISSLKPYLVTRMLDQDDRTIGAFLGYFERKQDRVPPISGARLQQLLAAGQRSSFLHERLASIEAAIQSLSGPKRQLIEDIVGGVSAEVYKSRLKQARLTVQRDNEPILYFTARAETECSFPTLFESRTEMVVRLMDETPMRHLG